MRSHGFPAHDTPVKFPTVALPRSAGFLKRWRQSVNRKNRFRRSRLKQWSGSSRSPCSIPSWAPGAWSPLLKKKRISVSAASIQSILRRRGLQNREKRLAKIEKRPPKARKPKSQPKKPATKITDDLAERIVEISLQNPDFGARRLLPLLKKEKIRIPSSTVYSVLKRRGLQTREKRLAKTAETIAEPVLFPKTFHEKIPPEVEERIVELSLQNPDFGARRLMSLLQQEEIFVSASAVYTVLKRNDIENRQKRLLKLEARQAPEVPPKPS